jgi:hypothetical protein
MAGLVPAISLREAVPSSVMAGFMPAIPIHWHGIARLSGITGTSPVMTKEGQARP